MRRVALAALMLATAAPAAARDDLGGNVPDYIEWLAENGGRPYPISGRCYSACTLRIVSAGARILPGAELGFHATSEWRGGPPNQHGYDHHPTIIAMRYPALAAAAKPCYLNREVTPACRFDYSRLRSFGVVACRWR